MHDFRTPRAPTRGIHPEGRYGGGHAARMRVWTDGARLGPTYHLRPRGWSSPVRSLPEHYSVLIAEPRAVTSPTHRLGNAWSSDPPMEIRQFLSKCIARRCFLTCLRDRHNRDRNSPRSAGAAPELLFLRSYQMAFIANARWAARDAASRIGSGITCVILHPLWGLTHGVLGSARLPHCILEAARAPGNCVGSGPWCGGFLTRLVLRIAYEIQIPKVTRDPVREPG